MRTDTDFTAHKYIATTVLAPIDEKTEEDLKVLFYDVAFSSKPTWRVLIKVGTTKHLMIQAMGPVDTEAEPNLDNDA